MPEVTGGWTFLTNHALVLLAVAERPDIRVREVARLVGVTERAVHRILADLVGEGYVTVTREGRRNSYTVNEGLPFRHPLKRHQEIGRLLAALEGTDADAGSSDGGG